MRLKAIPASVNCSHYALSSPSRKHDIGHPVSLTLLCDPFVPKKLSRSQSLNEISRCRTIRRSCSLNSDYIYRGEPSFRPEGLAKSNSDEADSEKISRLAVTKNRDSFLRSRFDFLEPMMLGIKPVYPDWPDRETGVRDCIERKAKSFDIPLSLRMIKKKLQSEEGNITVSKESPRCSVKATFTSMVFIIVELHVYAMRTREALCHEDLESISSKVQNEMRSSFVWLFEQVFSRTPSLMLHVMILLANFSVYSTSQIIAISEKQTHLDPRIDSSPSSSVSENGIEERGRIADYTDSIQRWGFYPSDFSEMNLWNSMVDDAKKMVVEDEVVLDRDTTRYSFSSVFVELDPNYLRTDLLYQMNLAQEPNNPLLLCNYAQFLHLVARDYDRAEECFKRAVQVSPPDAESLSQYANFLWMVRRDVVGAEERFLQALAVEPDSSYYASRYANFLWSTGGEETCYPINSSQN